MAKSEPIKFEFDAESFGNGVFRASLGVRGLGAATEIAGAYFADLDPEQATKTVVDECVTRIADGGEIADLEKIRAEILAEGAELVSQLVLTDLALAIKRAEA